MEGTGNAGDCWIGAALMGSIRRLDATGFPLLLARLAVGIAFLYYGVQKIADPIALNYLNQSFYCPEHSKRADGIRKCLAHTRGTIRA